MNSFLKEFLGYTAASYCALMVDVSALWVLVYFLSWNYMEASFTSFSASALKQHRLQDSRAEMASFLAIGAIGLVVNAAVIFVFVRFVGLNYLIAKCGAAAFTFTTNFVARRQLLFVRYSPQS